MIKDLIAIDQVYGFMGSKHHRHMYTVQSSAVKDLFGANQAYMYSTVKDVLVQIRHIYQYLQIRVGPNQAYVLVCTKTCLCKSSMCTNKFKDVLVQIRHMYCTYKYVLVQIRHMYKKVQRCVGPNQAYVQVCTKTYLSKSGICTSKLKDVLVKIREMYK